MPDTVFIFGAGASAQAGVPTMPNFLDRAQELWRSRAVERSAREFEVLFDAIGLLPQVHSKATLDIDNVESVFSAFEMAKIVGVFHDFDQQKLDQLDHAMRDVIAATIEETLQFPVEENRYVTPPRPYGDFAEYLYRFREYRRGDAASVITFNYDLGCDYAFHFHNVPTNYGLLADEPEYGVRLLKLHGSLNWGVCDQCEAIVPWPLGRYLGNRTWLDLSRVSSVRVRLTPELHKFTHHETPVRGPLIVSPTWGKASHHLSLSRVWNRAAKALASAENIFVIGYSLPPSDAFFKYLYALGTVGRTRIRRFWVFNPDPAVENRFQELLGPGVQPRFRFFRDNFASAIGIIRNELPADVP